VVAQELWIFKLQKAKILKNQLASLIYFYQNTYVYVKENVSLSSEFMIEFCSNP